MDHIDSDIKAAEKELDDDAESIITNERYIYIAADHQELLQEKESGSALSTSDKIDKVVTNRWLGLPDLRSGHVPCLLHRHGHRRRMLLPTGQTTDCSAMAGTCSASVQPRIMK